jgi:hypothetical protein
MKEKKKEKSSEKKEKRPAERKEKTLSGEPKKKKMKLDGPKRALSAYMYFSSAKRPELSAKNPGITVPEMAKMMGQMWKEASAEERAPFDKMAEEDKERYKRDVANGVTRAVPTTKVKETSSSSKNSKPTVSKSATKPSASTATLKVEPKSA